MNFVRYQLRHSTIYQYASSVHEADHLIRLTPRNLPFQRCLKHELKISPSAQYTTSHIDYFGNPCTKLVLNEVHDSFEITAHSEVAVAMPYSPNPGETPSWEAVRARLLTDRGSAGLDALEFTFPSPLIDPQPEMVDYALASFTPGRPILEASLDLTERIFREFVFDPTATSVATPMSEVVKTRRGVCQDFAHFQIGCLRSIGLAARYVSGYLETDPPPGGVKMIGADASHAWVGVFCPGLGWFELDPTNGILPSFRHIRIGWGRDYDDISPVRGVIHGGGNSHQLIVGVDVIPVGNVELPMAYEDPLVV